MSCLHDNSTMKRGLIVLNSECCGSPQSAPGLCVSNCEKNKFKGKGHYDSCCDLTLWGFCCVNELVVTQVLDLNTIGLKMWRIQWYLFSDSTITRSSIYLTWPFILHIQDLNLDELDLECESFDEVNRPTIGQSVRTNTVSLWTYSTTVWDTCM